MKLASFDWSRVVSLHARAPMQTLLSRAPFPTCHSGAIGLAIAGNEKNDRHVSPWQEAVGHEINPASHRNRGANEALTGRTLVLTL